MKTGRRQDPDGLRRMPRERDVAIGRVRKRPSMLLEFQGKHYNNRESSHSYHRHDHHNTDSGVKGHKRERYGSELCKGETTESRSSPYTQPLCSHHTSSLSLQERSVHPEINNSHEEGDVPVKRPRLLGDMQLDTPRSTDSLTSGPVPLVGSTARGRTLSHPASPPQGLGLSAYLEDIESDEGDLLVDEDDRPPGGPLSDITPPQQPVVSGQLSKEQLLQKMEAVDRDIAATESQVATLLKRQAELEGSMNSTPSTSTPSPLHPSPLPVSSSADDEGPEGEGVSSPPSPQTHRWGSPKRSLLTSLYSENKLKARSAHAVLHHLSPLPLSSSPTPLYSQPWEAPGYFDITARHRQFRPQLVQLIQRQREEKHEKDVALCRRYDVYVTDWKKRLDRAENSSKRKARDLKNRELFERTFPELKIRREQQERLMRVDQRGYGVVRSDLELSQVMCELYEQEEAPARTRRTHALIPAMVVGGPEERLAFRSTNGLIQDPMVLYRAAKLTNVWTDDEKAIFRDKYALYPKIFEAIASFLPCKTTADCVRYYYLSKKNEKFKQVARKASFKRRKFIKPSELGGLSPHTPARLGMEGKMRSPLLSEVVTPQTPPTTTMPTVTTPTTPRPEELTKEEPMTPKQPRYGDWTGEDIDRLRSGLRKWGRAWTKIYREVGGRKTATQCMQFFKDFSQDEGLGLAQALSDCNSIKSAEKAQRKAVSRKPARTTMTLARKRVGKIKTHHVEAESESGRMVEVREGESEALESASNCETGSAEEESGSESTITDSGPEDGSTVPAGSSHSSVYRSWKSHTPSASPTHSTQDGSEKGAFDLFISAAEALSNIVPPEVALHDHNYALAPLNSVELQGSSGLSLIAAAAAVVSPTLSRSAGSGRFPAVSPVRAPRGRPPNTQRRGSGGSTCKLSPTLLSPAGSSIYVPLTDTTKSSFRSRARSAPSDRPRIQLSRAGPSNLRYSISSKSSSPRPILPPASYTRTKDAQVTSGGAPSLKSMIASRPQHGNSSNAAFETLVNVAVAASPAELPKPTSGQPTATLSISFQNTSNSAPATPATTGSSLSDGTYSIDMSQAINILTLAHLAQNPVSTTGSSKNPQQLLLTPASSQASGILGTIVSQSNYEGGVGKTPNPGTVNVLIGHLTSGSASPSPSAPSESSVSARSSPGLHSDPSHQQKPGPPQTPSSTVPYHSPSSSSAPVSSEDLSNLNLLSSLVAVVAGTQASSTLPSHTTTSTQPDTGSYSFSKSVPSNQPPLTPSSTTTARSSAFKATNLPTAPVNTFAKSQDRKETNTRTKVQTSPNLSSLINSEHIRTSSRVPVANSPSPLDNLARCVVRSSSLTHSQSSLSTTNSSPHTHPSLPTYPSPSPSISQQSTLLLYTRSLSLPNPSGTEVSSEEEDHLESATRGISELSKLLGTDTRTEPLASSSTAPTSYRNSWGDQGAGVISTPPIRSRTPCGGSTAFSTKPDMGNDSSKYLSGLLESHSTHPQKTNSNSSTDLNISHSMSSR